MVWVEIRTVFKLHNLNHICYREVKIDHWFHTGNISLQGESPVFDPYNHNSLLPLHTVLCLYTLSPNTKGV